MKVALLISILSLTSVGHAKENTSADALAVDGACTSDAATAGCGSEKVGTGLLKCIHAYKKAHADFKISDACRGAMKTMHQNKKGGK